MSPISPPNSRRPNDNLIRAFVAVDLPEELRIRLGELIDRLSARIGRGTVRWVRPQGIHLTLKFLGDVGAARTEEIAGAVRSVTERHRPFQVEVGGVGCFPGPGRPRVLWVGVKEPAGALAKLQGEVEAGLAALGFPREDRPFSPHLTLARVRREASPVEAAKAGAFVAGLPSEILGEVEVGRVTLFRSELRPAGPVYTALAVANLGATDE